MTEPARIGPQEVRKKLESGEPTLLVCAYDKEIAFRKNRLEGAIPLSELEARLHSLSMDQEIVFY